jgi:hypothetical protein
LRDKATAKKPVKPSIREMTRHFLAQNIFDDKLTDWKIFDCHRPGGQYFKTFYAL